MPRINGSWNQSSWNGGPGQILWDEPNKFNYSEHINHGGPFGSIELEETKDIEVWKQLADGLGPRIKHTMTYIPEKHVFYNFGGRASGSTSQQDTLYEYNITTNVWKSIGLVDPPPARDSHASIWDNVNKLFWIYAGYATNPDRVLNDLWCYDPSTNLWTKKADGPGLRTDHSAVFDPLKGQIIIYGGRNGSVSKPLRDVNVYYTGNDTWAKKSNYTFRFYHDALWCSKTNSMLVYGGASGYSGNYLYVKELSEYFPNNDTWINRSGNVDRLRPVLAWDTSNEQLIMHGGGLGSSNYRNDTWYYDPDSDSWTKKMNGPPSRDFNDGDWDSKNNQLMISGGLENIPGKETWAYLPNTTGYRTTGLLISSVYNPGYRMKLTSISYNLSKPINPAIGPTPISIQIAGSEVSPNKANVFLGPDGTKNSYFTEEDEQFIPTFLDGSKYLAYKVNFRSWSNLYTPQLNWILIDYYNYPSSYKYESSIFDTNVEAGLPLRFVNWTSDEPSNTGIEIYFRQSSDNIDIKSTSWEKVSKGQTRFTYGPGRYFQYKAVLNTTERDKTPILETIKFIFNALPTKPTITSPLNNTWIGYSKPIISWEFDDPDSSDYQTAFQIRISDEKTLSHIIYDSDSVQSTNKSFNVDEVLDDGIYYLSISLCDNYGSWSDWSEISILKIDTLKPPRPVIQSSSHQKENNWYNNNDISLGWTEPTDESGINGYSFVLDRFQENEPSGNITMTDEEFRTIINQTGPTGLYVKNDVPDGIWYFYIKAVDILGHWSDTAIRMIKIDTKPTLLNDLTPKNVSMGSDLDFSFDLNDTGSGVDSAMLYWKYSSEIDFGYSELTADIKGNYSHNIKVKDTNDPTIEYYLKISDLSEPSNEVRYPNSGQYEINIIDDIPPVIVESTGDFDHNPAFDLVINVQATDNAAVSEANLYFKNQQGSRKMTKNPDGTFSIQIDRGELKDLVGVDNKDSIFYFIIIEDNSGNTARTPESGYFNISLKEVEDTDGTPSKSVDDKLFSNAILVNVIIIIIMIVIVAIIVIVFIKKQSKKISEDRHKLRMAIADTQEAVSLGSGAPQPEIKPIVQTPSYTSPQEPSGYPGEDQEIQAQQVSIDDAATPEPTQQHAQDIQAQKSDYEPGASSLPIENIQKPDEDQEDLGSSEPSTENVEELQQVRQNVVDKSKEKK